MNNDKNIKTAFAYILVTIFCALFGAVYEYFSHEVYSYFMLYAFIFPLVSAGAFLGMSLDLMKKSPSVGTRNLYHSGIATLTVGSIMRGVLDIYGTTNWLINIYWVVGSLLVVISIICYLVQLKFFK